MVRIALIYGAIAGTIVIAAMTLGIVLDGGQGHTGSQLFGYTIMIVALTLIFIGVKRHRDGNLGGVIKFAPAFGLGLPIACVAGVFYVVSWEIYLASTDYAFMSDYTAAIVEKRTAEGASAAELDKLIADMTAMTENYKNPLFRLPITFLEIFPVGLLVALVSAALLRNPKVLPARG